MILKDFPDHFSDVRCGLWAPKVYMCVRVVAYTPDEFDGNMEPIYTDEDIWA